MFSVLLIDDDPDVRALMAVVLKRLGCEALFAPNGVEGQALALQAQPDLILLDIMMDGQNGYETCANLRAQGYAGTIMLVSAISEDKGQLEAEICGADGYWQKPVTLQFLRERIAVWQS